MCNSLTSQRQNFYSHRTSCVELSSSPAAQSRHYLQIVQTTAKGRPLLETMNTALCDFWYAGAIKTLNYLVIIRNSESEPWRTYEMYAVSVF